MNSTTLICKCAWLTFPGCTAVSGIHLLCQSPARSRLGSECREMLLGDGGMLTCPTCPKAVSGEAPPGMSIQGTHLGQHKSWPK